MQNLVSNPIVSIILNIDSYKASQFRQYPKGTTKVYSHIIARKSKKFENVVVFGQQAYCKWLASVRVTMDMIDEAEQLILAHGEPFNREGWEYIATECAGKLPLEIRCVPDGTVMPLGNASATVVNTDDKCAWLTSYIETGALRASWFASTVASEAYEIMSIIRDAMQQTTGSTEGCEFKLHNFGDRGCSSSETAAIAGAAHLTSFMGTDSVLGLVWAMKNYNITDVPGFSIWASEHSTMCANANAVERDDYASAEKMVSELEAAVAAAPDGIPVLVAGVGDTYDMMRFARDYIGGDELRTRIVNSGGTFVVRPDSGDPTVMPLDVIEVLMEKFGYTVNEQGFRTLPDCIRVIQGDGINKQSIKKIIANMIDRKISMENLAFGMGGALTQGPQRDDMSWAMKACAMEIDGEWRPIFKDPITDSGKRSMGGRLSTFLTADGEYYLGDRDQDQSNATDVMVTGFLNGDAMNESTFDEVRVRVAAAQVAA